MRGISVVWVRGVHMQMWVEAYVVHWCASRPALPCPQQCILLFMRPQLAVSSM